jgi:hypothetical protein
MVEAGLVATGLQGFWVRAVVGIVFLAAVVGHLVIEEPERTRVAAHSARKVCAGAEDAALTRRDQFWRPMSEKHRSRAVRCEQKGGGR